MQDQQKSYEENLQAVNRGGFAPITSGTYLKLNNSARNLDEKAEKLEETPGRYRSNRVPREKM